MEDFQEEQLSSLLIICPDRSEYDRQKKIPVFQQKDIKGSADIRPGMRADWNTEAKADRNIGAKWQPFCCSLY